MAEAIISRRAKYLSNSSSSNLITEIITKSLSYTIPNHNGNISIRIFGGGGGGRNSGAGGGGWMNNAELDIENSTIVNITIGAGGSGTTSGGTTSFGTYLSANGGTVRDGGNGGNSGIYGVGGGGGGYGKGADGGDGGGLDGTWLGEQSPGGGGGGYFSRGSSRGGGGGYFTDAVGEGGAGYGIYAKGAERPSDGSSDGTQGVCIIQYYI